MKPPSPRGVRVPKHQLGAENVYSNLRVDDCPSILLAIHLVARWSVPHHIHCLQCSFESEPELFTPRSQVGNPCQLCALMSSCEGRFFFELARANGCLVPSREQTLAWPASYPSVTLLFELKRLCQRPSPQPPAARTRQLIHARLPIRVRASIRVQRRQSILLNRAHQPSAHARACAHDR